MTHALKLRPFGSSVGVIIPKEILGSLNVAEGDTVYLTQGADGYRVVANDPNFAQAMEIYRRGAKKYRNTLRELSK
jgi:putative addiction module antidote